LDGILLLLCHEPTATQLNLVPLASNGRVFTLDQLEIDHKVSSQANTIKQFVQHGGDGCRSPQPVRPSSKNYCQNHCPLLIVPRLLSDNTLTRRFTWQATEQKSMVSDEEEAAFLCNV
jgi:hypothetical protein